MMLAVVLLAMLALGSAAALQPASPAAPGSRRPEGSGENDLAAWTPNATREPPPPADSSPGPAPGLPWTSPPASPPPVSQGGAPGAPTGGPPPSPAEGEKEEEEEEEEDAPVNSGADLFCNCSLVGSVGECNVTGHCHCHPGYAGPSCDQCEEGYHPGQPHPRCLPCQCHPEDAVSSSCDSLGRCQCKPGATGIKCAQCQEGFSKFNGTSCRPCQCNNHSLQCDPLTGACLHCHGNTEGTYCENCKGQFYRNRSEQHECVRCPCSTEFSSGSCQIKPGQQTATCDDCHPGYVGPLCNECDRGYYSSDSVCLKCQCNGNVDLTLAPSVCRADTGECIGCLYHTAGAHCEKCQEGYAKRSEGANCTKEEYTPPPRLIPAAPSFKASTISPTSAFNATSARPTVQPAFPSPSSENGTSTLADVSWAQFNIIILTVIIILVVLLMGFVGAVYTYREYQNRKLNAPFWTIELKEDNISFSSYHDSIPNADISGLLEDDAHEVAPNGQLTLATPMHNYKA